MAAVGGLSFSRRYVSVVDEWACPRCQSRAHANDERAFVRRVPFADTLNCGDGDDVVYARDTVGVDCEHSIPALKQVIAFL